MSARFSSAAQGLRRLPALLVAAAALWTAQARSQPLPGPPEPAVPIPGGDFDAPRASTVPWSSLSAGQQQLLGHLQNRWETLPPARQQALANGATRWLSMSPEERAGARARFQAWQRLPPDQRVLIRRRWQQFQRLPPQQQRAVMQNLRAFSRLPPDQRAQLRQRWLNATPLQRQQMLQRQQLLRQRGGSGMRAPPQHFARAGRGPR
jgi:hypothetical protein